MSEADDKFASDAVKRKLNMKKFLMTLALGGFALGASAQYQVQNSDFEQWDDVTYNKITGKEPSHWNSFITGTGGLKGMACTVCQLEQSKDVRPGSKGSWSAKISDHEVKILWFTTYAQGNMTTGCINMGNANAGNSGESAETNIKNRGKETATKGTGNYNYTETANDDFNQRFVGLPDAMRVWVKFVSSKSDFRAKATTILHTSGYFQDPEPTKKDCPAKVVATAKNENIAPSQQWQELTIPFDYSMKETRPSYALVSFSTNKEPGTGTGKDYMLIDDLEYIYYHSLIDLKYDGKTLDGFSENTLNYDLSGVVYDANKLLPTKKGEGATIKKSFNEETGVLTIAVKGDDLSNNPASVTTYTVQFAKPENQEVEYTNGLSVNVNGQCTAPQSTTYKVVTKPNGDVSLVLKNFMLGTGNEAQGVGTIVLDKVKVDGNHYTADQVITIQAGDDPNVGFWMGTILGEVPVKLDGTLHDGRLDATIDIDMSATLGQVIKVILAHLYEATPAKALTIPADGLGNVTFNRTFSKGWNTFVAPFPVTKKQLGYEKANTLASISTSAGWLKFEDVADETLEANKPYLLYYSADKTLKEFYYGGEVLSTTGDVKATVAGQGGAKVSMVGNYNPKSSIVVGNYLLTELSGEDVIVKAGSKATVDATKCYFMFENVANPAALSVKFGGDVTGMGNVVAEETAPRANGVYNLQGVKLSNGSVEGLPAGLYIVNGRKVLVK